MNMRRPDSEVGPQRILGSFSMGLAVLLCLTLSGGRDSSGCTIVTMARGGQVLVGNNEDWTDPRTKMWIIPATDDQYGRVVFGFAGSFIQGGINQHGLFLDANALAPTGWQRDPAKPVFEENINDYILAHCATVDDAIAFFNHYSVYLGGGKFVIADARGDSIVVEWAEGADRITRRSGFYQISTNIPQWSIVPGKVQDERYTIAEKVILSRNEVSVPALRAVLAATHKEWSYPTIYSYICDLKTLRVSVYNFHNFEEAYTFDLPTELKKTRREYDIPALFEVKTFAAIAHDANAPKLGVVELQQKLAEGGLEAAISWYESVKDEHRKVYQYSFFEDLFLQLGTDLQDEGKPQEALDVLRFSTHAFPDSANAWVQLGEGYLKAGDRALAIETYQKALKAFPDDAELRAALSRSSQ
jgi:tetratricopeptide (TPR) repeat protein